ncbi:MAG: hypothetical protein IPK44_14870 [Candidatus Accumulibacter sp.]|uniref:helix-turn-helix domain-containing protein n=1 Tax=Accumulibacter sp. TaxID=2053492 RepID=UPI00258F3539|nr:hypothetical protein [Accumulibacter sp.]MBK8115698.1 hypothetical protein [Accumulibacter sp.]
MSRKAKTLALTEEERRQLTQINERGSDWRERRRARTVLLLDKGLSISAVVTEQKIHKETVACHRDAWLQKLRSDTSRASTASVAGFLPYEGGAGA